jgi:hypothetical protein
MAELDRQQAGAEEVMKDREVLPDRLIDTHPVEHTSLLPHHSRGQAPPAGPVPLAAEARVGLGLGSRAMAMGW